MQLSNKRIQEFKAIAEKESGKEISWKEAQDGAYNLLQLAELSFDFSQTDQKRKNKLKENPKGFHLEGVGYTCFICRDSISNEETWYDKWGIKCLICQKAIDKKIIPGSIAKNEDLWYSKYDLQSRFCIDRHAMNRFIKWGVLKPRIVKNENGTAHAYLFLIKDNKDTLPPKELTKSQLVKEKGRDGIERFHSEPWYRFTKDPHKTLEGYKIIDYLKITHEREKTKK